MNNLENIAEVEALDGAEIMEIMKKNRAAHDAEEKAKNDAADADLFRIFKEKNDAKNTDAMISAIHQSQRQPVVNLSINGAEASGKNVRFEINDRYSAVTLQSVCSVLSLIAVTALIVLEFMHLI